MESTSDAFFYSTTFEPFQLSIHTDWRRQTVRMRDPTESRPSGARTSASWHGHGFALRHREGSEGRQKRWKSDAGARR